MCGSALFWNPSIEGYEFISIDVLAEQLGAASFGSFPNATRDESVIDDEIMSRCCIVHSH